VTEKVCHTQTRSTAINDVLLYPNTSSPVMEGKMKGKMKKVVLFLCEDKKCTLEHDKSRYLQGEILVCKKV